VHKKHAMKTGMKEREGGVLVIGGVGQSFPWWWYKPDTNIGWVVMGTSVAFSSVSEAIATCGEICKVYLRG